MRLPCTGVAAVWRPAGKEVKGERGRKGEERAVRACGCAYTGGGEGRRSVRRAPRRAQRRKSGRWPSEGNPLSPCGEGRTSRSCTDGPAPKKGAKLFQNKTTHWRRILESRFSWTFSTLGSQVQSFSLLPQRASRGAGGHAAGSARIKKGAKLDTKRLEITGIPAQEERWFKHYTARSLK